MIFMRRLFPDGGEYLGTLDFIRLDARRSHARILSDAQYHADARGWAGFNLYRARDLAGDWTLLHKELRDDN